MARNLPPHSACARFAAKLKAHLDAGTRPGGIGEPWKIAAFATATGNSPRAPSHWCNGSVLPNVIEPILAALFGAMHNQQSDEREELRRLFQEARAEKQSATLARAKRDPAGPQWVVAGDQLVIDREARRSDERAAGVPVQQQLQQASRDLALELAEKAARLANSLLWGGLAKLAAAFAQRLDGDPLPELGRLYADLLRLGRHLETNHRLRREPRSEKDPLPADIHGLLADLVQLAAPWLGSFPTVAAWDAQAGRMLERVSRLEPAVKLVRTAAQTHAITTGDADEILHLAVTGADADAESLQGQKAARRAEGGAYNLLIEAAALLAAAALAETRGDTRRPLLIRRLAATLADTATAMQDLAAPAPAALRLALEALAEQSRTLRHPLPTPTIPEDVEKLARAMILQGRTPPAAWRPHIRALTFSFDPLANLGPLSDLTSLQTLSLVRTQVGDLTPIAGLASLQTLYLDPSLISHVPEGLARRLGAGLVSASSEPTAADSDSSTQETP